MNVVPSPCGTGTVPLSASKNPVLGVFRHHCGEIATVHQPKGSKKSHLRYLICPKCKCDQASGEAYQAKIRANMAPTIEQLVALESLVEEEEAINGPLDTGNVPVTTLAPIPTQTNEHAVSDGIDTQTMTDDVIMVNDTGKDTRLTGNDIDSEPHVVVEPVSSILPDTPDEQPNAAKTRRVGVFAVAGGVLGALLALVA